MSLTELLIKLNELNIHINLEKENQPIEYLQDLLNQGDYDLVYCIGAKALGSIDFIVCYFV